MSTLEFEKNIEYWNEIENPNINAWRYRIGLGLVELMGFIYSIGGFVLWTQKHQPNINYDMWGPLV